jgi:hypothetical protein
MNKKKPSKNQTFLHDLVNHTHGLLLYLNQKKRIGKMDLSDIEELINELKLMQNFIRVEGEFVHRDISDLDINVGIEEILKISKSLISLYFPESIVDFKTNIDHLKYDPSQNLKLNSVLYYRVLSNVIKNISEATPTFVEIIFSYSGEGFLSIETKNDFKIKVDENSQLRLSTGLFSIKSLLENIGGSFECSGSSNLWMNSMTIPFSRVLSKADRAA